MGYVRACCSFLFHGVLLKIRSLSWQRKLLLAVILMVGVPAGLAVGLATAAALGAFIPLVITATLIVLMLIYYAVRFIEFVSGDDTYTDPFISFGDGIAGAVFYGSLFNLVGGWEVWLVLVHSVRSLRHRMFLELEAIKWVELGLIFSAFCFLITLPRVILIVARDDGSHKRRKEDEDEVDRFVDGLVGAAESVFFLVAELAVMRHAPRWKHHVAFGFETWKFIQILVFILLGIMFISLASRLIVVVMLRLFGEWKHVVYFAKNLRTNANFVVISTLFLIVWRKCFLPRFERAKVASDTTLEYLGWAFVCLTIGAVLWLIKKCIVSMWKAHAVYDRFYSKIMDAGKQLYFLQKLGIAGASSPSKDKTDAPPNSILKFFDKMIPGNKPKSSTTEEEKCQANTDDQKGKTEGLLVKEEIRSTLGTPEEEERRINTDDQERKAEGLLVHEEITSILIPTHQLQHVTAYFHNIEHELKNRDNSITTKFTKENATTISTGKDLQAAINKLIGEGQLQDKDAEVLYTQIEQIDERKGIDAKKFEKWVVKAQRNCWELSNTVIGAKEVAEYLNILLTGLFLPLVILVWLLVTKITTIKLLALLTSPILAATFIFGETCKNIFKGILFAFVMHIFDVGDIVTINDTQMEVKRIGIWKTTFIKVDTNERIIYQNSILADKLITKHKGGLDLNDTVEYCVPIETWTSTTFDNLKAGIDEYLKNSDGRYQKHDLGVLVTEVGDKTVKVAIHFKHKTGDQDMFYSQTLKKLNKHKAKLLMKTKQILDEMKSNYIELD